MYHHQGLKSGDSGPGKVGPPYRLYLIRLLVARPSNYEKFYVARAQSVARSPKLNDGPADAKKEMRVEYLVKRGEDELSERRPDLAFGTFTEAVETARGEKDSHWEASALLGRARARLAMGDPDAAMEDDVRALELFEKAGDRKNMAVVFSAIGALHGRSGQFGVAEHFLREALKAASDIDDRLLMAKAHLELGVCMLEQERLTEALAQFRQAIAAHKNAGSGPEVLDMVLVYKKMAEVFKRKDDHSAAVYYLTKAEEAARLGGHSAIHARILAFLAESLVYIGNVDRAQAHLQEGLEVLTVRNDHQGMMTALRVKGLLHRRLHDFETAGDYLDESLRMAREIGSSQGEVLTLLEMARLDSDQGKPGEALTRLGEAEGLCNSPLAHRLKAEVLKMKNDIERQAG
jgi:tetratricopeptide (TPR) repeat protein